MKEGQWKLNHPCKGQKSFVVKGEIQKSKCVKRHQEEIAIDLARPMTIPMTTKEKRDAKEVR